MQRTAREYGMMMRQSGVVWPAPVIGKADMTAPGVSVFKIKSRSLDDVFVLSRRGWATVYVNPKYSGYRGAFDRVMPRTSTGLDVDHLNPKSRAKSTEFIALGRISHGSNRSHSDDDSMFAMTQKVRDMVRMNPHQFCSKLTLMELGWGAVTCYLRPMDEVNQGVLDRV